MGDVRVNAKVLYGAVHDAFKAAGFTCETGSRKALLVWWDAVKDNDYFSGLKPFQIVNRLPGINNICRKAPFVRLIHRIQGFFPSLYSFLPQSYILPCQNDEFMEAVARHDRKHIVKPDEGSLGAGITILEPTDSYTPTEELAVAQEYVDSCLVDSTKFDCRIYALIASVKPLKIFVYRGGVARFCSEKSTGNSIYAQLTNVTLNRQNPDADLSKISRMVTDVFEILEKQGVDTEKLWERIDSAIVLTIISAYGYIAAAEAAKCPPCVYPRCFQILGFDVLIDENYNPCILEVNYRPMLDTHGEVEQRMKTHMLANAMRIAVPLGCVQRAVSETGETFRSRREWKAFLDANESLVREIQANLAESSENRAFVQVFPGHHPDYPKWLEVLEKVKTMPTAYEPETELPVALTVPSVRNTSLSVRIVPSSTEEETKRPSKPLKNASLSANRNPQKRSLEKTSATKPSVSTMSRKQKP